MQPYFFPYIGYFQLISSADKFILYDDVNYINRGWINRNNVLVDGKSSLITLPLKGASQNKLIYEVDIENEGKGIEKLIKTIHFNYKKAPHFDRVIPLIEGAFENASKNIAEFNFLELKLVCNYLGIETHIESTSRSYNNSNLKGAERILDICLRESAKVYINPIGGTELYQKEAFVERGIDLFFLKPMLTEYKQFNQSFVPWLSIIDVLMFNTIEQTKQLLKQYQLVEYVQTGKNS